VEDFKMANVKRRGWDNIEKKEQRGKIVTFHMYGFY